MKRFFNLIFQHHKKMNYRPLIPRVKICCIGSISEASLAIHYGASAIGLVSQMPSGPGPISEELIQNIAENTPASVSTFLLTSKVDGQEIVQQVRRCKTNTIQLVDELPLQDYKIIREQLPGISIVQVIHVQGRESVEQAIKVSSYVDGILLDSGRPKEKIKELGGTGRTHDWDLSKQIVESVKSPVFLAGGKIICKFFLLISLF